MNRTNYVRNSLELHLFFARIMKEHALFLEAGFTPKDKPLAQAAEKYKNEFKNILEHAVHLGNGIVSPEILTSQELITNYTYQAEQKTSALTGIPIDINLTLLEANLNSKKNDYVTEEMVAYVRKINKNARLLLENFITYQKQLLDSVLTCQIFTYNYPLMIDHLIEEAKLYLAYMNRLENNQTIEGDKEGQRRFWNEIMMEHALFIRGLLDPSESNLIHEANDFAKRYQELMKEMSNLGINLNHDQQKEEILTEKFKEFKQSGTKGIVECKIRSIIVPLLADHVLREANHYLRILKEKK